VRLIRVEGPLFFASGYHLRNAISRVNDHRCSILDLDQVPFLDMTGVEILEEAVGLFRRRGCEVVLAQPSDPVAQRLRDLDGQQFPSLRDCPVYHELSDAMIHAATAIGCDDLCQACRPEGRCAAVQQALEGLEKPKGTSVPRARAVIARGRGRPFGSWEPEDDAHGRPRRLSRSRFERARRPRGIAGTLGPPSPPQHSSIPVPQ
jgi:anti-anti-sigma regulatory factor